MGEPWNLEKIRSLIGINVEVSDIITTHCCTAFQYTGFDLSEWLKVVIKKISTSLEKKKKENIFQIGDSKVPLTLADVITMSVQIGLMRGNSTSKKIVDNSPAESKDLLTFINGITGHQGKTTPNKKYGATEFTYLRAVSAWPHIASLLLNRHENIAIKDDTMFGCQKLPAALHHGNTYALTSALPDEVETREKRVLYFACCAVAAYITAKTTSLRGEALKERCIMNEKFVSLQRGHPMYDGEGEEILKLYKTWGIFENKKDKGEVSEDVVNVCMSYMRFRGLTADVLDEE